MLTECLHDVKTLSICFRLSSIDFIGVAVYTRFYLAVVCGSVRRLSVGAPSLFRSERSSLWTAKHYDEQSSVKGGQPIPRPLPPIASCGPWRLILPGSRYGMRDSLERKQW